MKVVIVVIIVNVNVGVGLRSADDIVAEVIIVFVGAVGDISDAAPIVAAKRGKSVRLDGEDLQITKSRDAL